jgi:DNA polymerase III alpha subunit
MTDLSPIQLSNYLLWPDGSISVDPDNVIDFIFKLSSQANGLKKLYVTSLTPEIIAYNAVSDHKLKIKTSCDFSFPPAWNLPEKYLSLDLDDYLLKLIDKIDHDSLYDKRVERLSTEIFLFKQLKLDEVLRTIIYVIDEMTEKKVVWGVGRGSSCSSYLLYLMGLHEIDAVLYDIDIEDFLHLTENDK